MSDSIKSQSQMRTLVTDDFRSEHERIFGERKPVRGSWVLDPTTGKMVPREEYVPPHGDGRVMVASDLYMDGERAPDGTDIGSRAKRRAYMRANGLADASDYTQHWKKAKAEREQVSRGEFDRRERRETVGRVAYELSQRRPKR